MFQEENQDQENTTKENFVSAPPKQEGVENISVVEKTSIVETIYKLVKILYNS